MKTGAMKVGWFSAGCSSLVACRIADPDEIIYIHVPNQHPDTIRFLMDAGGGCSIAR